MDFIKSFATSTYNVLDKLAGDPTPQAKRRNLKIITWLAVLLDSKFKLGPIKLGLAPFIKMVPMGGAFLGIGLTTYIGYLSLKFNLSPMALFKMYAIPIFSFFVSWMPLFGQPVSALIDAVFKPSIRQVHILRDYLSTDEQALVQKDLASAGH